MAGFDNYDELLDQLGKYKTRKSCLYINRLEQVDVEVLKQLHKKIGRLYEKKYD